jgi:single-strand DNA-binding protein
MARSLNKVTLIGNLTREPQDRYLPSGTMVCTFGIATNREWMNDSNERQEQVEYHNIAAWGKLGEICKSLLHKGDKAYIEGRLQTREWQGKDGNQAKMTEVVAENMILLSSRSGRSDEGATFEPSAAKEAPKAKAKAVVEESLPADEVSEVQDIDDDIPF